MSTPTALLKGLVSRFLQSGFKDDASRDRTARMGRYGAFSADDAGGQTRHGTTDEGTYLLATTPVVGTAFGQALTGAISVYTIPTVYIFNQELFGGKSLFLDYVKFVLVNPSGGVLAPTSYAVMIDSAPRTYTTDGSTVVVPICSNSSAPIATPLIKVTSGGNGTVSVLTLLSANSKTVARGAMCSAPVAGNVMRVNFGASDMGVGGTTSGSYGDCSPPVIIPPGYSMSFLLADQRSNNTLEFEIGMWAR